MPAEVISNKPTNPQIYTTKLFKHLKFNKGYDEKSIFHIVMKKRQALPLFAINFSTIGIYDLGADLTSRIPVLTKAEPSSGFYARTKETQKMRPLGAREGLASGRRSYAEYCTDSDERSGEITSFNKENAVQSTAPTPTNAAVRSLASTQTTGHEHACSSSGSTHCW